MKTLIINGSPRPSGDTVSLIRMLENKLDGECWVLDAYRCKISPCIDCRFCRTHSGCAIQDDMQMVYAYIQDCDNIVIASPIYFSEVTGKVLDLCSRLQTWYCARTFRGETPVSKTKKGAVILVGGGDGAPDRAYSTACTLLHQMNCTEIHELVCSHQTELRPAASDARAAAGIGSIAGFFSGCLNLQQRPFEVFPE